MLKPLSAIFLILTASPGLIGCHNGATAPEASTVVERTSQKAADRSSPEVRNEALLTSFDVSKVTLNCEIDACPAQIGLLLFSWQKSPGEWELRQCTAFLIRQNLIMSDGHCDYTGSGHGHFFLRLPSGQTRAHRIIKTIYKKFTPHATDPRKLSGRIEGAVFQLETPVHHAIPLRLAYGSAKIYSQLISYVVNPRPSPPGQLLYSMNRLDCEVHRHGGIFPYDLSEAPAVIRAFSCRTALGNSGAPLFSPDSDEVEGIVQGGDSPQNPNEIPNMMLTNVRCLDFLSRPRVPCVEVTEIETERRQRTTNNRTYAELGNRAAPLLQTYDTKFNVNRYELIPLNEGQSVDYEIIYYPKCRIGEHEITSLAIPIEYVQIQKNQWAEPKIVSVHAQVITADLRSLGNDIYSTRVPWPASPRPYKDPATDLRKSKSREFNIALPVCPR